MVCRHWGGKPLSLNMWIYCILIFDRRSVYFGSIVGSDYYLLLILLCITMYYHVLVYATMAYMP